MKFSWLYYTQKIINLGVTYRCLLKLNPNDMLGLRKSRDLRKGFPSVCQTEGNEKLIS